MICLKSTSHSSQQTLINAYLIYFFDNMGKKKKNNTIKIVAAVVVIVAVLAILWFMGIFNAILPTADTDLNPTSMDACLVDLQSSDVEIYTALGTLMGKTLNFYNVSIYIDALHMKMYGDTCHSALQAMEVYEADYTLDGWTTVGVRSSTYGIGWFAYYESWTRGDQARFVAAGEGAILTSTYGYSTVLLTAYGPITTVEQFILECR